MGWMHKVCNSGSQILPCNTHTHTHTHTYIYIYIYIYCHPQTDCFIVLQLFSVARHVGRLKLGSKPAQLYLRLSIRPLSQQTYHVNLGNYKVLCSNISSSVRLFTFLYLTGCQSARFVRRALHHAIGSRKLFCHGGAHVCVYMYKRSNIDIEH